MKYGVLVVSARFTPSDDMKAINIGDMFQSISILNIYHGMGIPDEDIVFIDLADLNTYKGEYLILPININMSLNWVVDIFPLPAHILPIFLGLSFFSAEELPRDLADYFRFYAPIGCRDEATLDLMRDNNIPAFLFGCVTTLLPKRTEKGNKIFLVDVPDSFMEFAHDFIETNSTDIEILSQISDEDGITTTNGTFEIGKRRLEKYCKEAKLVISSRLHVVSPCIALGIPVIAVTDNISPRMGFVDKFVKYYTPSNYSEIDFGGYVYDLDYVKNNFKEIAKRRIKELSQKYKTECDLSYYYETREKSQYGNYYWEQLKKIDNQQIRQYVIWGTGQIGMNLHAVLEKAYPEAEFVGAIDSYCDGTFYGKTIERPDAIINKYPNAFVFIATYSGRNAALEYMKKNKKVENVNYIYMGSKVG